MRGRLGVWLAVALAVFLVGIEPAWRANVLARIAASSLPATGAPSPNEEEHAHAPVREVRVDALGDRPRRNRTTASRATGRQVSAPEPPALRPPQIHPPHPSRFSARRLI